MTYVSIKMNITLINLVFSTKRQSFYGKVVESHYHLKKVIFKLYCPKLCHRVGCLSLRALPESVL